MYRVGEILKFKVLDLYFHYGIATGDGRVISLGRRGVQAELESRFGAGRKVISEGVPNPLFAQEAVRRAWRMRSTGYSLWSRNCEHFWRAAYGLEPKSPQVRKGLSLLALAAIGGLAIRVRR